MKSITLFLVILLISVAVYATPNEDLLRAVQSGDVDGRLEGDDRIVFSFEGMDEMDPVNGAGTATLKGDRMIFRLMYHYGDDFTFECERRR